MRLDAHGGLSIDKLPKEVRPVTALFEDREGNIWSGDASGVERFRDSSAKSFGRAEGLPSETIGPIYIDGKGEVWFGPRDGGLYRLKGAQTERVQIAGLMNSVVLSLTGRGDDLWIGLERGGLAHLVVGNGRLENKAVLQPEWLAHTSVYAVQVAKDGAVWAGTLGRGVSRLKHGTVTSYTNAESLLSNTVTAIAEGLQGAMWFATPNGLSQLADGRWKSYGELHGLPSGNLNCLFQDSKGVLWIGSAEGLAFLNGGRVGIPRELSPALHEQIFGIAEDKENGLYIETPNRILRFRRTGLFDGSPMEDNVREFGPADGIRSTEGMKRDRSVIGDSQGRIWFSTSRGMSVIDPTELTARRAAVLVHINSVSADNTPLHVDDSVHIPPAQHRILFRYEGVTLSNPERVEYRYKLDNFDRDWSPPSRTGEAVYTNLGPKSYTFHVIARNSDGAWSSTGKTVAVTVEPSYWETWWFRCSLFVVILVGGIALYQMRLRNLRRQFSLRLAERLAERTRIARELHDTLLQSFHGLVLSFEAAHSLLPEKPVEAERAIANAIDRADQAIAEGRDAVQELRANVLHDNDLPNAFRALCKDLADLARSTAQPAFEVIVEGGILQLRSDILDAMFRIGREAILNALHHATPKQIDVEIRYERRLFRLCVRDNGIGIEPALLQRGGVPGHWGLVGMREHAERIGAQLNILSEVGKGTEVMVTISASLAYAKAK